MTDFIQLWQRCDKVLVALVMLLCSIGVVMVSSSSIDYANHHYGQPLFFSMRQSIFFVLAIVAGTVAFYIPTQHWLTYGWLYLMLAFLLLVLVLIPGIGKEVNGSRRWIPLGLVNIQASEVAKLFMLIYMSGYLLRRRDEVRQRWRGFLKPIAVLVIAIVLLLEEPDFGSAVVIMFAVFGMIFLAGLGFPQFITLMTAALIAVVSMAVSSSYRLARLKCFLDPWQESNRFDCGYQLTQSLIAFGRGEWTGLGLGQSIQKQFFLPEAHTDFVFAIIAEELGFVGGVLTIALFAFLIGKLFLLSKCLDQKKAFFEAYLINGIALVLAAQVFINVGVNIGLLPTKGLTLPFLSYGGSSLLVNLFMLGIVLRIDAQFRGNSSKKEKPQSTSQNTSKKAISQSSKSEHAKHQLPRSLPR